MPTMHAIIWRLSLTVPAEQKSQEHAVRACNGLLQCQHVRGLQFPLYADA